MSTVTDRAGVRGLRERLDLTRQRLRAGLQSDGTTAHQIAIDAFVWATAYVEAADATLAWADELGDDTTRAIADTALDMAQEQVEGLGLSAGILLQERCASLIPAALTPGLGMGA